MAGRNPDELEEELRAIEFEGNVQTLGTYQVAVRPVPWWLTLGGVLVVGVVIASGLVTQTYRAVQDVRAWRRRSVKDYK